MSQYDNPFDSGDSNPFNDAGGRGRGAPAPAYSNLGGQFATGSFYDSAPGVSPARPAPLAPEPGVTVDVPLGNTRELKRKEKELAAKEAALKKKEEELRRRELAAGINVRNWPYCFPILHHDIANDIPAESQFRMRTAYWTWLGIMLCLVFNAFGVAAAWVGGAFSTSSGIANFFLALMYIFIGIPLSYFLWYKRLYTAMKKDGAISFALFFLFYLLHIGFCIFAAVAPPFLFKGNSFTGVITTIQMFADDHAVIGIIYAIGSSFFILESLLSVFVIQQVYMAFRGAGRSNQIRGELAMAAVR